MYIFIKIFQITLVLLVSLTLHIIHWVPSLLIENVVNLSIIGLFIFAGYLVYLIMQRLYRGDKKKNIYKSIAYTFLLFTYLGIFAIAQIGISIGESRYMKTYAFDDVTFYTYKTIEDATEVSKKDDFLPMRSLPIATFDDVAILLQKEGNYLYAKGDDIHSRVYDFKNNKPFEHLKNKEKND